MKKSFYCFSCSVLAVVLITSCSSVKENENLNRDVFDYLSQQLKHNDNEKSDIAKVKLNTQNEIISCKNNVMSKALGKWFDHQKKIISELDSISSYNKLYAEIFEKFGSCTKNQLQSLLFTDLVLNMVEKSNKKNVQWSLPLKKDELIHLWKKSYIYSYWWDMNSAENILDYFLKNLKKMTGENYWTIVMGNGQVNKNKILDIFKKQHYVFSKEIFNYTSSFDIRDLSESKASCDKISKTLEVAKKSKSIFDSSKAEVIASLMLIYYSRFCPFDKNSNLSKVQELYEVYLPALYSK